MTTQFSVGDIVIAGKATDHIPYAGQEGRVVEEINGRHCVVEFSDGVQKTYHRDWLRAVSRPDPAWDEYDQSEDT